MERGDFVVNRQATTLHTRKTGQVPLRHNSHQTGRKSMCKDIGTFVTGDSAKEDFGVKRRLQPKEKICSGLIFSFGCTVRMGE